MLSFASEFPVDARHAPSDFLSASFAWILGSPHTRFTAGDLATLRGGADKRVEKDRERVEALGFAADSEAAAGLKYTRRDDELEWTTSVVFTRKAGEAWVGIRVSCESHHPATRLPAAKKPVIVRALLRDLGGGSDRGLLVQSAPHRLAEAEVDIAGRLITGGIGCRLPIVYVSAGFDGRSTVDNDSLANELAGMAHVVVEPSRTFSQRLKVAVAGENVYGGTIGIYWPDGGGRRAFFLGRHFERPEDIQRGIVEEITAALVNRRALDRCTWPYLLEGVSRQALSELKASGSQELDKYIATFDRDLAAKDERLVTAEREIERLKADLRRYEARMPIGAATLLRSGTEQDLYQDELVAIVRDALVDARARILAGSRRAHVLDDILEANPPVEDRAAEFREGLKELLRGSRTVDSEVRRGLEGIGFDISGDGKHFKLVFRGDDRYTFTLPKSGGDHRGGLNAASQIARQLF